MMGKQTAGSLRAKAMSEFFVVRSSLLDLELTGHSAMHEA
jgi:hypothetical protein